jgi:hypothetical protein
VEVLDGAPHPCCGGRRRRRAAPGRAAAGLGRHGAGCGGIRTTRRWLPWPVAALQCARELTVGRGCTKGCANRWRAPLFAPPFSSLTLLHRGYLQMHIAQTAGDGLSGLVCEGGS